MDYSQGYLTRLQKKQKRKRSIRLWLFIGICIVTSIVLINLRPTVDSTTIHMDADGITPSPTPIPSPTAPPNSSQLQNTVQSALDGTHGSYGIVVQDLKTGEYYGFNQHQVFKSGSLYKLWVMTVVYQQIQAGQLHLSDTLSKDLGDLAKEFNISIDPTESQTSGMLTMTVQDALYQMITISDNNAALLLTDKVHVSTLASFLQKNGFTESKVGTNGEDPTTTASDIALFFNKLYKNQLADSEQTQNMVNLLKQQRLNEKIPLNLPNNTPIAHKTGEIDNYSHDAGIVYGPNDDYIIVVLTQSDDTNAAINRIANVSEAVYSYFESNPTQ